MTNATTTESDRSTFAVRVYAQIRLDRHDNDVAPKRVFEMAARWDPDLDPPVQTRTGGDARAVIANLGAGEGVTIDSLAAALTWLERAEVYYRTTEPPFEGYRGPWEEAVRDMQEASRWLRSLLAVTATVPTELRVQLPVDESIAPETSDARAVATIPTNLKD